MLTGVVYEMCRLPTSPENMRYCQYTHFPLVFYGMIKGTTRNTAMETGKLHCHGDRKGVA